MNKRLLLLFVLLCGGCYSVRFPESTEDPNDPNRGPILISFGEIEYPYEGKANLEGKVEVELAIDTAGNVTDVKVLQRKFNADAVLTASGKTVDIKDIVDKPIIAFYMQCKFMPGLRNSKPIEYRLRTGMNYRLKK